MMSAWPAVHSLLSNALLHPHAPRWRTRHLLMLHSVL